MANKLKRNYIQLKSGEKENGEPVLETFLTPHFISGDIWYECMDTMEEAELLEEKAKEAMEKAKEDGGNASVSSAQLMKKQVDLLADTVVKVYNGQFDKKTLIKNCHAPGLIETLNAQVEFVAMGQQDAATKKFVESQS